MTNEKIKYGNIEALRSLMNDCPASIDLKPVVLFGALLGIVRDSDLISWNNDIELGVHEDNWKESIIDEVCLKMRSNGYIVNYYSLNKAISIRDKNGHGELHINRFVERNNMICRPLEPSDLRYANFFSFYLYFCALLLTADLDINSLKLTKRVFYSINKILSNRVRQIFALIILKIALMFTTCKGIFLFPFNIQNTKPHKFHNVIINIPIEPEKVIQSIYGDNWRIPKRGWSYYDPKNANITKIMKLNERWDYKNNH